MAVLSKVLVPLAVLPLVTAATVVALHLALLLLSIVALLAGGIALAPLWTG